MNKFSRRGKKILFGVLAMTMVAGMLTGCRSNSASDQTYSTLAQNGGEVYYETAAAAGDYWNEGADYAYEAYPEYEEYYDEAGYEMADAEKGEVNLGNADLEITSSQNRKLIQRVSLSVETDQFDTFMTQLDEQIAALGGYIEYEYSYNGSSYSTYNQVRSASITVRIPDDKVSDFVSNVSGIGNVVSKTTSAEDVTLQYVDTESRKAMYLAQQESLLALLEKAETVEDIAYLTEQLAQVRYNIESMESQLRTYDNLVDYATVDLEISEVEVYTPVAPVEQTTWERITTGFKASMDDVISGLKNFFINMLINAPYILRTLIILAIIVGIIWIIVLIIKAIIKKMIKKFKAKAEAKKAAQANAPKANVQPNKTLAQAPAPTQAQAQAPVQAPAQAPAQDAEKKEETK
ncbi:MAG: DUF4349 domain-containing protein [Lachnospiraceae bacterium]|nr:DUF4349 domain-containing protein [Lachnospiraceae bacterium]